MVGLSLDGDMEANRFRVDANGTNRFYKILNAAQMLTMHEVDFNILTVLTGYAAENIDRIYSFFKRKGFKYLQFIPCLRPFGDKSESELYMTNEQYAHFLIHLFNAYVKDYVRGEYTSIRQFDNWVQMYVGRAPEQCGVCGHCTHQFVVEGNGNVYPCDFYCLDEWLLGNINSDGLEAMANSKRPRILSGRALRLTKSARRAAIIRSAAAADASAAEPTATTARRIRNFCLLPAVVPRICRRSKPMNIKFRPGGAKYNVMCPVRTVHFQRANWTKNNHLLPITYEFCIAV